MLPILSTFILYSIELVEFLSRFNLYTGLTTDVSVKEELTDRTLKELHRASENGLGGDSINIRFFQYLEKVFGSKVISRFKNETKNKVSLYDLETDIEIKKRNLDFDCNGYMRIDIPPRLVDIYEEIEMKDFEEHIKNVRC